MVVPRILSWSTTLFLFPFFPVGSHGIYPAFKLYKKRQIPTQVLSCFTPHHFSCHTVFNTLLDFHQDSFIICLLLVFPTFQSQPSVLQRQTDDIPKSNKPPTSFSRFSSIPFIICYRLPFWIPFEFSNFPIRR